MSSTKTKTITIAASDDDLAVVAALITAHPLASRHAVVRAAFRAGLSQMRRDEEYALDRLHQEAEQRRIARIGKDGEA